MSIVFKMLKRIVALLFTLVIITVVGILAWRIFSSDAPKSMETVYATPELVSLYEKEGKDAYMFRQNQRSITSGKESYGYFSITDYVIIPDANQIQTTFRYNNSTLTHVAEDYGLGEVPAREDDVFDVTLLFAIDLTPEDTDDNLGNDRDSVNFVRCHGEVVLSEEKNLYNFRKLVFDADTCGIDLGELLDSERLLAIYVDFYYEGDIDYEENAYGTLCIYDFKSEDILVKLDKNDVKALEQYEE